ncbi:hypothetical protein HanXRQr2_Chr14g0636831 [Helianthus annuus]|uniref:Uncharacterized protein n=1 Tax=Helianthus annuus TaxID=4232 RepID=A0A9K3E7Y7_HELAN|nr:hypothetical protein HanXRQr2_Chr14g0636831 [Helianthus annuus]KAJ0839771.1 hypothetical protein HanPSC8_Chr14g0610821 [Helianthus annuus]
MEVVVLHLSHPRPPPLQLWFKSTITVAAIRAGITSGSLKRTPSPLRVSSDIRILVIVGFRHRFRSLEVAIRKELRWGEAWMMVTEQWTISWYVAGTGCSSGEDGCGRVSWRWGFRFGWCLMEKMVMVEGWG